MQYYLMKTWSRTVEAGETNVTSTNPGFVAIAQEEGTITYNQSHATNQSIDVLKGQSIPIVMTEIVSTTAKLTIGF